MTDSALIGRLWRDYIARYTAELLAIAPVLALVALSGVSYGLILKYAVDNISAGDQLAVIVTPIAVIIATSIRASAMWGQAILTQGLSLKVLRDVQGVMFVKLMHADFARFQRESTGALVSRFTNDVGVIAAGLVRAAQAVLRDSLTLIGAIGSMLWFDWALTLLVLGVFALAGGPLASIARRAQRQTAVAQVQMGVLTSLLSESLGAARFVKTFGLEAHEADRARAGFENRRKIAMKQARNSRRAEPLLEIIGGLALAGVLYVAGLRIASEAMTIGDLIGMVGAIGIATPAARSLAGFNTILNEGLAALKRIFAMMDEPVQVRDKPNAKALNAITGAISFENVSFAYDTQGESGAAIDSISFTVAPGETVALVGPSGAGKSTIFNLLPRLYDVTAGAVKIDGQDVREVTLASLRGAVTLVAQEATLFSDTIRANIAFGRAGASQAEIETAARAAAAHEFILAQPLGYDTPVGERGGNLSGGERQRIALARAFLRDAPILLLDEATSALDAESEAKVQAALKRLEQGRTTLVIAHRLSTVRDADRILVMEKGRIVESGAHDVLLAKGGLYARLCQLQFQDSAEA